VPRSDVDAVERACHQSIEVPREFLGRSHQMRAGDPPGPRPALNGSDDRLIRGRDLGAESSRQEGGWVPLCGISTRRLLGPGGWGVCFGIYSRGAGFAGRSGGRLSRRSVSMGCRRQPRDGRPVVSIET
jgi:hypothetical protein